MLLTVICVTYNASAAVRETLDSIAAQTDSNFELLVVDGASRDDTVAIAKSYEGRVPLLTLWSEPDRGLYDAMNKGIARAKGQYVLFLNAGDVFHDRRVIADFEMLVSGCDPAPALVYGHTNVIMHDGKAFMRHVRDLSYIRHGQPTIHQSVFFLRESHLQHLYPFESYPISSDYASMAAIQKSNLGRVLTWDRVVSDFHNDPTSVSNRVLWPRIVDAWRVQRDVIGVALPRRVYSAVKRTAAHIFYNIRPARSQSR